MLFAVLALMYTGGYWGEDAKFHTFQAAIGNSSASISLVFASFGALIVALLMYVPRKLMSFADFASGSVEGMKLMLPANIILILAWTLSGVCRDLLQTPVFMEHIVVSSGMSAMFLPFLIFCLAAFLSFSMGTAWGTFGILIPIVVPIIQALDPSLTVVVLSATLAGSVFLRAARGLLRGAGLSGRGPVGRQPSAVAGGLLLCACRPDGAAARHRQQKSRLSGGRGLAPGFQQRAGAAAAACC